VCSDMVYRYHESVPKLFERRAIEKEGVIVHNAGLLEAAIKHENGRRVQRWLYIILYVPIYKKTKGVFRYGYIFY